MPIVEADALKVEPAELIGDAVKPSRTSRTTSRHACCDTSSRPAVAEPDRVDVQREVAERILAPPPAT